VIKTLARFVEECMTAQEVLEVIGLGETTTVQFKEAFDHQDKIAAEMIAFANTKGGMILFGVIE
jgi:predicted HTH transcriptional regulator